MAAVATDEPTPVEATPAEPPLGPRADPRTFLRDDDFPRWIRELPALPPRPMPPVAVLAAPATEPELPVAPVADPDPPATPLLDPPLVEQERSGQALPVVVETAEPPPPQASSPPVPAASPELPPRRREPWETPLLVVLVVGVIMAVIWALVVNGLILSDL